MANLTGKRMERFEEKRSTTDFILNIFSLMATVVITIKAAIGMLSYPGQAASMSYIIMPLVAVVLFLIADTLYYYPGILHYPVDVTPANKLTLYRLGRKLIKAVACLVLMSMGEMTNYVNRYILTGQGSLGLWCLGLGVLGSAVVSVVFMKRATTLAQGAQ